MGDLKIGEYYRTKKGLIRKINTIHTPETRGVSWRKSNILLVNGKHSLKDIYDHNEDIRKLIYLGDYVIFFDTCLPAEYIYSIEEKDGKYKFNKHKNVKEDEIKFIVTNESFIKDGYKIGG